MIDIITTTELRRLAEVRGERCVSIYLPTHPAGDDRTQDPIRLKNLVARATDELDSVGAERPDIDRLLGSIAEHQDDWAFWTHLGRGLAVFAAPQGTRMYRLPDPVDELVVVTDRLHIKPLLRCVSTGETFHVLALSQNQVRLLRGSRYSVDELALGDVPDSLAQALRFDDRESQLQHHGGRRTGTGHVTATFHGHGLGKDDHDTDLDRFLTAVDSGVRGLLDDPWAPVVLAGVDRIVTRFRRLTHLRSVVDTSIPGNPEHVRADELHDRAWPLVAPIFDAAQRRARDRILGHADRSTSSLADAVVAARDGRVESLFVPVGVQRWGRVDAETRSVEEHDEREPGDRDLLDSAALDTLLTGGAVFAVDPADVPGTGPLAAALRF